MKSVRSLWIVMALLLLGPAAVALAAWLVTTATAPALNAQEGNDLVLVPFLNESFGSINIDDECLVTNRRELEGPVLADGMLRFQGVMVVTSSCPGGSGSSELETEVQVFSVLCAKSEALDTHALCDVKLVAQERLGHSSGGG